MASASRAMRARLSTTTNVHSCRLRADGAHCPHATMASKSSRGMARS